ncbi:hypothetical protein CAPTEDRAFT_227791 [Capitella teleta]|uniref:EGF-like domain-containing protein n=1 Tax=Capitella teleta TaxID=283909 RepID=R7VCU1_CAPTE|nr:hypothetical protein CAPTEDRAFT_227791 [Capitella teleta]|eukprot:ELU16382.1 hypothetical protein CAPTEDRAFT_227791 [Capitella teleta]
MAAVFRVLFLVLFYLPATNGECGEIADCESCFNQQPVCTKCQQGWFIASDQVTCLQCPENCVRCVDLNSDDQAECVECIAEYGLSADQFTCTDCKDSDAHCIQCTDDNNDGGVNCTTCDVGYTAKANGQGCTECNDHCEEGSCFDANSDGVAECKLCESGYAPSFNKTRCLNCKDSDAHCIQCTDDNNDGGVHCTTCDVGYTAKANGQGCTECNDHCEEGSCFDANSDGVAECKLCESGYAPSFNKTRCLNCDYASCMNCVDIDQNGKFDHDDRCTECAHRQTPYPPRYRTCKVCPNMCKQCTWIDQQTPACHICYDNCGLRADNRSCVDCFDSDNDDTAETCLRCHDTFIPDENQLVCHACPDNCASGCAYSSSETAAICTECDPGFTASANKSECLRNQQSNVESLEINASC